MIVSVCIKLCLAFHFANENFLFTSSYSFPNLNAYLNKSLPHNSSFQARKYFDEHFCFELTILQQPNPCISFKTRRNKRYWQMNNKIWLLQCNGYKQLHRSEQSHLVQWGNSTTELAVCEIQQTQSWFVMIPQQLLSIIYIGLPFCYIYNNPHII